MHLLNMLHYQHYFLLLITDSGPSEPVASPPNSLLVIANDACYSVEGYQSDNEDSEVKLRCIKNHIILSIIVCLTSVRKHKSITLLQ